MNTVQVKIYNKNIASTKQRLAVEAWRKGDYGYGYPVDSMFYFMNENHRGEPTTQRKNGYVCYDNNMAFFGATPEEAEAKYYGGHKMKKGAVVKFKDPVDKIEKLSRFILLEEPDFDIGRVLVQEICNMAIPRTTIFNIDELIICNEEKMSEW